MSHIENISKNDAANLIVLMYDIILAFELKPGELQHEQFLLDGEAGWLDNQDMLVYVSR